MAEAVAEEPTGMGKGEVVVEAKPTPGHEEDVERRRRHTSARRAEARQQCGCGRVISCSRDQERWRTKLELCRGESFDDGHRSAALGTAPQRVRCRSGRRFRFVFWWSGVESGEAPWQQGGAPSVGEEAEVADADEALGEQVK